MDNEGNASVDTRTSGTTVTPEKKSSSTKAPTTPRTKSANASKRSRTGRRIKSKVPVAIWVAVIGSVTTIVTTVVLALPNLLPFIPLVQPSPTTTFTQTPTNVDKTTLFITDTLTLTVFPSATFTPTVAFTPTATATIQPSPAPLFIVRLVADKTTGRAPLIVKFDARDSTLHEWDGTQLSCQLGSCYYTWKVFFNGQPMGKSANNTSGKFEYIFRERGTYTVTVYICRGQDRVDCNSSAIWIEATR